MRIYLGAVVCAVAITSLAVAIEADDAEREFLRGDWMRAAEAYDALTREEPTVEGLNRLGDIYLYLDDLDAAEVAFGRAAALGENPDSEISLLLIRVMKGEADADELSSVAQRHAKKARYWRATGMYLMRAGQPRKAIEHLSKATEADPKDFMSHFFTGLIYEDARLCDTAIPEYENAITANPLFAQAYNNLGYCYKERRYFTYAIDMYERAIDLRPAIPDYHYNAGNAYALKNMFYEAELSYARAVELDPTFAKAHYNLAQTYVERGRFNDGIASLRKYIEHWDESLNSENAPPPKTVKEEIRELQRRAEGASR